MRYLIGIGANLGDRLGNIDDACRRLAERGADFVRSPLYETAPMYITDQPAFLNAVARLDAHLDPSAMLAVLHDVERAIGRVRSERYGPRAIDLDIVAAGDAVMHTEALTVPHPRLAERAFVLVPLRDVAPEWRHPLTGESADQMLAAVAVADREEVRRWETS